MTYCQRLLWRLPALKQGMDLVHFAHKQTIYSVLKEATKDLQSRCRPPNM